jgi:hypothetical protein
MTRKSEMLKKSGFVLAMLGALWLTDLQQIRAIPLSSGELQQERLRPIRIQIPEDGPVTIEGLATREAVSYQSGNRFVVIVPQASVASFQNDLSGREFLSVKVEQRGDDVEITFLMRQGNTARVERVANSISVVFSLPQVAALMTNGSSANDAQPALTPRANAANSSTTNAAANAPTLNVSNPVSTTSAAGLPAPPPPVPQGTPTLGNLLQGIAGLIPGATKDLQASFSNIDLSVPESPAFTVLGVTPNAIVRPGTPRELATSLLNGLDKNGNFQTGLAIDTAPYMLFNGANITLQDYNDYYLTRLLSRTQFSMATTKGAAKDDTATRLALGLNLTLWDKGDARVYHPKRGPEGDVLTCFKANIQPPDAPSSAMPTGAEIAAINAKAIAANNRVADACRDKVRKANWNATSWVIAYAPSWITKNGQNTSLKWNGGAFWSSFAYGFDGVPSLSKIGQLILHARYRTNEQVADPLRPGQFIAQNASFFGARFRAGNPDFAFNLEASYIRNRVPVNRIFTSSRFAFGAEVKISDNFYFVVTGGDGPGDAGTAKKGFFMSSFKYGFNKKSQLNPQP